MKKRILILCRTNPRVKSHWTRMIVWRIWQTVCLGTKDWTRIFVNNWRSFSHVFFLSFYLYVFLWGINPVIQMKEKNSTEIIQQIFPPNDYCCCPTDNRNHACIHKFCYNYNKLRNKFCCFIQNLGLHQLYPEKQSMKNCCQKKLWSKVCSLGMWMKMTALHGIRYTKNG
jgi:hypothetical protein